MNESNQCVKVQIGTYILEPSPAQVSIQNNANNTGSGKKLSVTSTATLNGIIFKGKGDGGIKCLLESKAEMEKELTGCKDCLLMTMCCGDTIIFQEFVRVTGITFEPGSDNWTTTIPYTINLEWYPKHSVDCNSCLVSFSDSYDVSPIEEDSVSYVSGQCVIPLRGFNVSRNLSAQGTKCCFISGQELGTIPISGVDIFDTECREGWEVARDWVLEQATCIPALSCATLIPSGKDYSFYNHSRNKSYSCSDGSYNITDNWTLLPSGIGAQETFSLDIQNSNAECTTTYNINGSITGFEEIDCDASGSWCITSTKFESANKYLESVKGTLVDRIECLCPSGICPINRSPVSSAITKSPGTGTVSYNYSFVDTPQYIPGSLSESISIDETIPSSRVNEVYVLGQRQPILQDCGSLTSRQKNVNFSAVMPRLKCPVLIDCDDVNNDFADSYLNISGLNDMLCCIEKQLFLAYDNVKKVSDQINWDPYRCIYNRSVSWIYKDCDEDFPSGICV